MGDPIPGITGSVPLVASAAGMGPAEFEETRAAEWVAVAGEDLEYETGGGGGGSGSCAAPIRPDFRVMSLIGFVMGEVRWGGAVRARLPSCTASPALSAAAATAAAAGVLTLAGLTSCSAVPLGREEAGPGFPFG